MEVAMLYMPFKVTLWLSYFWSVSGNVRVTQNVSEGLSRFLVTFTLFLTSSFNFFKSFQNLILRKNFLLITKNLPIFGMFQNSVYDRLLIGNWLFTLSSWVILPKLQHWHHLSGLDYTYSQFYMPGIWERIVFPFGFRLDTRSSKCIRICQNGWYSGKYSLLKFEQNLFKNNNILFKNGLTLLIFQWSVSYSK